MQLKFNNDNSVTSGQIEAIKFCIRKHNEGWTIEDFKMELKNALKMNICDDYIKGIISGFRYNLKIMEESNERT